MSDSELAFLLQERVKELECHNQLTLLLSQGNLENDVLLFSTAKLLVEAFQFPTLAKVEISLHEYVYRMEGFYTSNLKLVQPIVIDDLPIGNIIVVYPEKNFPKPLEPFFEEEKKLLLTVALRLGKYQDEKEKDAALHKSENLYRSILRSSPDAVIITDLDGTIRMASPSADLLMGADPDDDSLLGRNIFEVIHPEDRENAILAVQGIHSNEVREPSGYRVVRLDGSIVEVESNADYIRDEKGIPAQMIVITRNVSERNREARKLVESQTAYKEMVETINDVIFEVSKDSTIRFVSPAIERMLGYKPEELIGESFFNYMHPDDRASMVEAFNHLGNKDYSYLEYRYFNKAGEPYWVRSSTRALYEDGHIVGGRGVIIDINEKKLQDAALHELNTNLERLVAERTEELEKFFTVSLDLLCIADSEGHFIRVNKSWEELLGYATYELEGKLFLDFVHPDDLQATLNEMASLSEQKKVLYFTNRYRAKNGDYKFIEWYSVPDGETIYAAAHDVTERKKAEDFENELLELSAMLTGLPLIEIDPAIRLSLQRIGTFLGADRSYLFEIDEGSDTMDNTFEWCQEGIPSEIDRLQGVPCDIYPNWLNILRRGENVEISKVSDLPSTWLNERATLEAQAIQSLIFIPLFVETKLMGFVGLDSVRKSKKYSSSEINTLRVWGSMLVSLINRKKNENQLEQTRQNLQTFFDTIDDLLWVVDEERRIIYANPSTEKSLDYTSEELLGLSVRRLHQESDWEDIDRAALDLLDGRKSSMSFPLLSRSGRLIPVETKLKQGYWDGKPAIYAIGKDLSEVQISEKKFATAFHSNPTMMAISRMRDGVYVEVNNTFMEILGYKSEELIGHSDKELHLIVDPDLKDTIMANVRKGNVIRKLEMQMRAKNGEIRTGLISADSILVGDEQCVITVTIDITERKKAEVELLLARQEAELANLAKSEFLSRMSHELRTPMNSILGFAQLLEMGELTAAQRKGVGHILHSGKHLLDLINEVLDISRIEAGRLSLSLEPVEVEKLMKETIDIVLPLASNNQVVLEKIPPLDAPLFVQSDHQRLKQILLNLLNNGIKYNKPGGTLSIRANQIKHVDDNLDWVRISVTDTGIGVGSENLGRIFDAFERIGAEKTEQEGTGLGLAVVKKLVDVLHGRIGVESQLGEGSTFWVEFTQAENPTDRLNQMKPSQDNESASVLEGCLLYVEDNSSNIELVEQILAVQNTDINLVTTKWGREAHRLAVEYKPKLILLDLNLPDIPGELALQQLLNHEETRDIPVVIISADAMPKQTERLLKAGARKFLTKPIDIAEFLDVITFYLSGKN